MFCLHINSIDVQKLCFNRVVHEVFFLQILLQANISSVRGFISQKKWHEMFLYLERNIKRANEKKSQLVFKVRPNKPHRFPRTYSLNTSNNNHLLVKS